MSRDVLIQVPNVEAAKAFCQDSLGLEVIQEKDGFVGLDARGFHLFLDQGESLGPVSEFVVPDIETARDELLKAGCELVRWEDDGPRHYMRDAFGLTFNLRAED